MTAAAVILDMLDRPHMLSVPPSIRFTLCRLRSERS